MSNYKYLVTGGAGFIGSNIVEELLHRQQTVVVFDNFATGRRENIEPFRRDIELVEGDLRDADAVRKAMKGCDFVLHQAALPSVPRSVADPAASNAVNITGTLNVLLAARDLGVRRVVAASSSSVYGDTPTLPKVEEMPVLPLSPYAVTKLAAEKYCAAFHRVYGLETVSLRYFNIFGPRQDPTSQYSAVIPRFVTAMQSGKAPVIYGDGTQSRDFTFVANAVVANLLACEANAAAGDFFNVAGGERFSLLELARSLRDIMGVTVEPVHEAARPGDVKHSQAGIAKIQKSLGYRPLVSFKDGLQRTVDFFLRGTG